MVLILMVTYLNHYKTNGNLLKPLQDMELEKNLPKMSLKHGVIVFSVICLQTTAGQLWKTGQIC